MITMEWLEILKLSILIGLLIIIPFLYLLSQAIHLAIRKFFPTVYLKMRENFIEEEIKKLNKLYDQQNISKEDRLVNDLEDLNEN